MREIKVSERAGIRDIECHKSQPNSSDTYFCNVQRKTKPNNSPKWQNFHPSSQTILDKVTKFLYRYGELLK